MELKEALDRISQLEEEVSRLKHGIPYDDEGDDDWDDDYDEDDWREEQEERKMEELAERAATCRCGAWQFAKNGTVVHVADCCCGAE